MPSSNEVREFYDEFAKYEQQQGINLRHYRIFNELARWGLKKNHHVLEIGCGIGQLTSLLSRYLKQGHLVATDISPASVEWAKKRVRDNRRAEFHVTDMTDFEYTRQFDFIVLPDVLEHIPIDFHGSLFQKLSSLLKKEGTIMIHIPHPDLIEFDTANQPGIMQIIDQPLAADELLKACYPHGLVLERFDAYALFHEVRDYIFIVLRKHDLPVYRKMPRWKIILHKQWNRFLASLKMI